MDAIRDSGLPSDSEAQTNDNGRRRVMVPTTPSEHPIVDAPPPPADGASAPAAPDASTAELKRADAPPAAKKKPSALGWVLFVTAALIAVIFAGVWGMNSASVSAPAPAASAPAESPPASSGKVMAATASPQLPASAPAAAVVAPASQPSVASLVWPAFSDPRDKPEDWKECGEFLKRRSGLWEPAIEPIPANTKCVLKARELGLAR
jgi:hypothetical protein